MSISISNPNTAGVTSVNSETGAVSIVAGSNVSVSASSPTITVSSGPGVSLFTKNVQTNTSRLIGTVYQNTTGQALIVVMSIANNTGNAVTGTVVCDASPTPTTVVNEQTWKNVTVGYGACFMFIVPPNYYYKISGSATISFGAWIEWTINSGTVTFSGELSGSRVLGTIYQNTSASPILVAADISGVASGIAVVGTSDATPSPTTIVWQSSPPIAPPPTVFGNSMAWMVVPASHYYKVTCSTGGTAVAHWNEYTLPFNAVKSSDLVAAPPQRAIVPGTSFLDGTVGYVSPIFTNTTGKDMFVAVNTIDTTTTCTEVICSALTTTALNSELLLTAQMGVATISNTQSSVIGLVQIGEFFLVGNDAGTNTANHWWEYQLG